MIKNLFSTVLILSLIACSSHENRTKNNTDKINQKQDSVISHSLKKETVLLAMMEADQVVPVQFLVNGKLEKGDLLLSENGRFKKNQLLFKINSEALYFQLVKEKEELTRLLFIAIAEMETAAPSERQKWIDFLKLISNDELLPAFPSINEIREKVVITDNKVDQQYFKIRKMEKEMSQYFLLAPFSGTIQQLKTNVGGFVKKGDVFAQLVSNQFHLKMNVASIQISAYKLGDIFEIRMMDNDSLVGSATISSISKLVVKDSIALQLNFQKLDKRFLIHGLKFKLSPALLQ